MRIFIVLLLACLALPAVAQDVAKMTVSGEARVTAVPDLARVSLGAEGAGETAVAAMNETSVALEAILAQLKALGVAEADIQTRDLSVRERSRWDPERNRDVFLGYEATNLLEVRLRDMNLLGEILSEVLSDGANSLGRLDFEMTDPAPLRAEARRQAVSDAMDKAALFAGAAGVRVGRVLSISDSARPLVEGPRTLALEAAVVAESAADVPVAIGEVSVRAEVTMVFEILQ